MYQWNIINQQQLSSQIQRGTLPHALLICGVNGAGKNELARWLVDVFNCKSPVIENNIYQACQSCKTCLLSKSDTNPDTTEVVSKERTISVEEIRRASSFLETRPQIALGKSVLLPNAEKLTVSAANALLKTLEEPNDNCLIVLYCDDTESVLPTILSRCQLINIRPFVGKTLTETIGFSGDDPYLNINHLAELKDERIGAAYNDYIDLLAEYASTGKLSPAFEDMVCHHEHGLVWLERCLTNLMRKQNDWAVSVSLTKINHHWSPSLLWQLYQLVIEAKKKLKLLMQANPVFVKEQLLVDIHACIKKSEVLS